MPAQPRAIVLRSRANPGFSQTVVERPRGPDALAYERRLLRCRLARKSHARLYATLDDRRAIYAFAFPLPDADQADTRDRPGVLLRTLQRPRKKPLNYAPIVEACAFRFAQDLRRAGDWQPRFSTPQQARAQILGYLDRFKARYRRVHARPHEDAYVRGFVQGITAPLAPVRFSAGELPVRFDALAGPAPEQTCWACGHAGPLSLSGGGRWMCRDEDACRSRLHPEDGWMHKTASTNRPSSYTPPQTPGPRYRHLYNERGEVTIIAAPAGSDPTALLTRDELSVLLTRADRNSSAALDDALWL